jgi:hypothetical protein
MSNFDEVIQEYKKRGVEFTDKQITDFKLSKEWLDECVVCDVCKTHLLHDDEAYFCAVTNEHLCDEHSVQYALGDEGVFVRTDMVISEDDFDEKYTMVKNTISKDESSLNDCMFETYGPEVAHVRSMDSKYVWTFTDAPNGDIDFVSGFHQGFRIGYFITEQSHDNKYIQVNLDFNDDRVR